MAALEASVGHPDMVEFLKASQGARTFADLESEVRRGLGKTGLMLFMKLDHGEILRKETGLDTPKIVRFSETDLSGFRCKKSEHFTKSLKTFTIRQFE